MAIKAQAHIVGIGPYDSSNSYIEVKMVADHSGNPDMHSELFVIPISGNVNQDVRDAVKSWLNTNWSVTFGLGDTVQVFGGASLL